MRPLDDGERRRLLTWSALLCAVSVCLAPLAGRSSFELAGEQAVFNARFPTVPLESVWSDRPVNVARDPFVPEGGAARLRIEPASSGIVGLHVTQGQSMGFVLPPNRGAAGTPISDAALAIPSVTAIVTGASPRALVDDGSHVRVVGVGDMLAGSRIAAIDASGVRLQNGTVLALAEETP